MLVKDLTTNLSASLTRSYYFILTGLIKTLFFVPIPSFKKKSAKTVVPSPKSEPDTPPPLLHKSNAQNWQEIINFRKSKGFKVKPIKHRKDVPQSFHCPDCGAPHDYIYANGYSFFCSLCGRQVKKNAKKSQPHKYLKLFCPFCGAPLNWKKERSCFIVYKCVNHDCGYKSKNNLRYTWRLFTVSDKSPFQNTPDSILLKRSHHSIHIIAAAIYFAVNLALSSTVIRGVISTLFTAPISHKSIDNWKYAAANILYKFFYSQKIDLPPTIVIDETYLHIQGKLHYLYAAINPQSKEVIAFFLSKKRNANAAFNLFQLITKRTNDPSLPCRIITDGAPFYPPAIACPKLILNTNFSHDIVIGLKDNNPRRTFKNMIERLWVPLHKSYNSHHGLKNFDATIAHCTLFFTYYNFFRPHQAIDNKTPSSLNNINPDDNAIKKWIDLLAIASTA